MARKGNFFINDIMKTNGNGLMSVEELGLKYQITNACMFYNNLLRDRPYNLKGGLWFFDSFRIFFSDNTRVTIFFCCRAKREFFFLEYNIGLYDKNSESDYFFSSTKIRIFFSATLRIRILF